MASGHSKDVQTITIPLIGDDFTPEKLAALSVLVGHDRAQHLAQIGGVAIVESAPSESDIHFARAHKQLETWLEHDEKRKSARQRIMEKSPGYGDDAKIDEFLVAHYKAGWLEFDNACQAFTTQILLAASRRFGKGRHSARTHADAVSYLRDELSKIYGRGPVRPEPDFSPRP